MRRPSVSTGFEARARAVWILAGSIAVLAIACGGATTASIGGPDGADSGGAVAPDGESGVDPATDAADAPEPLDSGAIDAASDAARADAGDAAVDSPAPVYAKSCADLPNGAAGLSVTLYWDKDPTKPYAAFCGANAATYVLLNDTTGLNKTTYPLGTSGCTSLVNGQSKPVVTTWTMIRFDPVTKVVDTGDAAGATSTGGTHEDSGNNAIHTDYLKMPFASGRVCDDSGSFANVATIDLSKTNLAVAKLQTWSHDGYEGASSVTADAKYKKLTLSVAGYSAGVSPCPPNADYYTTTGGKCLTLEYAP